MYVLLALGVCRIQSWTYFQCTPAGDVDQLSRSRLHIGQFHGFHIAAQIDFSIDLESDPLGTISNQRRLYRMSMPLRSVTDSTEYLKLSFLNFQASRQLTRHFYYTAPRILFESEGLRSLRFIATFHLPREARRQSRWCVRCSWDV